MIEIVSAPICKSEVTAAVESPGAGAIVTFDGTVRNHARGRSVQHLYYESYQAMALKQMQEIRSEALQRFAIHDLAIVHRVGRLEIGESSVFIAVAAAHRADAFQACRYAIDRLKMTVPIWKKEYYSDGEVWVDEHAPASTPS